MDFLPICELSAYNNKWTIKARVTQKAQLRTFAKGSGQGKVFSCDLLDAAGGEIRASFFNEAADKFFDVLEKGKCFTFSKGSIKIANKQYNATSHKYEIAFDKAAIVEAAADDSNIETIKFNFLNLKALGAKTLPCTVDLCGVVTSFKPTQSLTGKDGQELIKREVTLADESATSFQVTLWGERAKQEDKVFEGNPVIALKAVSVKEFNNSRSGSLLQGGALMFDSSAPEAKRNKDWWAQGGSTQELVQLSQQGGAGGGSAASRNAAWTTLAGMRLATERLSAQPENFNVVARLALVQTRKQGEPQPLHYMACQEPKEGGRACNKKCDESGFCPSCNRAGKVAPRMNIRCRFVDFEDSAWLTSFHEGAAKILGMSGEEIRALELGAAEKGEAGREELDNVIRKRYFEKPIMVTVRAKMESYNGEPRSNVSIIDARPVSYAEHGRQMLKDIRELLAKEANAGA